MPFWCIARTFKILTYDVSYSEYTCFTHSALNEYEFSMNIETKLVFYGNDSITEWGSRVVTEIYGIDFNWSLRINRVLAIQLRSSYSLMLYQTRKSSEKHQVKCTSFYYCCGYSRYFSIQSISNCMIFCLIYL